MSVFDKDNLVAWCIVPFDACKRTPKERAEMLKELGIRALAYDWREEHISTFDEELHQLRAHGLRMVAFYLLGGWPENEAAARANKLISAGLDFVERNSLRMDLWLHCQMKEVENIADDARKLDEAAQRVSVMADIINGLGCRLSLYNHGGWGGEPEIMTGISARLKDKNVGIVYNFHHGHEHIDRMPDAFTAMLPYLTCVNINGTTVGGEKIIALGSGERDLSILQMIRDSGYSGPIGILGHQQGVDVRDSLTRNLKGLQKLLHELGDNEALASYE